MRNESSLFLEYLIHEKKYSVHTISAYEKDLDSFINFMQNEMEFNSIQEITHFQIRTWLSSLMQDKVSSASVKRKVSSLRSFYKYLLKKSIIDKNPMDKVVAPKAVKSLPKFVNKNALNELIDSIEVNEDDLFEWQKKIILLIFYHTGIRRSELINLNISDIDVGQKYLKVLGKGNKERLVPFANELSKELDKFIALRKRKFEGSILIVNKKGEKVNPKYIYNVVSSFLSKINVASQVSPHVLRHSYATNLLNNGADINAIKELLGHANLNATQIYTQNSIESLKNIHRKMHPKS